MLLVCHTQVRENYASDGGFWMKCKGGHTYLLARLSANRAAALGKAGLADLARERRPHAEHHLLPEDLTGCGDYEELVVSWELVEDSYQTQEQRDWDRYPEMNFFGTRPVLEDRTELSDGARRRAAERLTAEGILTDLPGETIWEYHARARRWVAERREQSEERVPA